MSSNSCLNCGNQVTSGFIFCPVCGQKTAVHRLNYHDLSHDAIHYFTHADKGIFSLVRELAVRPGTVAREYVEGRRTHYFKPLNFFLLVAAVLVLVTSFLYSEQENTRGRFENRPGTTTNTEIKTANEKVLKRYKNVNKITSRYSNFINMLATPLIAFLFWLFYRRERYNFIEHLVANMYFVAFTMLVYSLIIYPLTYLSENSKIDLALLVLLFCFEILYRAFAYYHFMNKPGKGQFARAAFISAATVLIWITLSFSLISMYIRTGFFGLLE